VANLDTRQFALRWRQRAQQKISGRIASLHEFVHSNATVEELEIKVL
jgi:hypothetical protein